MLKHGEARSNVDVALLRSLGIEGRVYDEFRTDNRFNIDMSINARSVLRLMCSSKWGPMPSTC